MDDLDKRKPEIREYTEQTAKLKAELPEYAELEEKVRMLQTIRQNVRTAEEAQKTAEENIRVLEKQLKDLEEEQESLSSADADQAVMSGKIDRLNKEIESAEQTGRELADISSLSQEIHRLSG